MKKYILPILLLFLFQSCTQEASVNLENAQESITEESLIRHIEILSSDEFEGRAPATPGEELTVSYIVDQLEAMGIAPGMPDGSFVQEFPLLGQQVNRETSSFVIRKEGEIAENLEFGTQFMAWPSNEEERIQVENAEVVYVGYGVVAPEYGWNDFKDVDVSGKILVFKNNDPSHDPEIFEGDARLYYGRWSYKFEIAEEMGALGAIIIHTTPTAGYGWSVVENSWGRERFAVQREAFNPDEVPQFNSWLTQESSAALFSLAGLSLDEMLEAAADREFSPVTLEGITIEADLSATYSNMYAKNVIGKIEGADRTLRDEFVIFSAHHDHLGVDVDGVSIYNGAHDNASGVASVLEIANSLKQIESSLKRTVLFMFVGAEEMGLLGSRYWAENPTVHPGKVSANINLDSVQIYGETNDQVVIGYGRNNMTDLFREHVEAEGRVVKPDPRPEQGSFYRSDHFSYARVGIPAFYPNSGRDFVNKPENWSAVIDSVNAANYHTVNDVINEYWDMAGMVKDMRLMFRFAVDVINHDSMMEWVPGDEFEAVRMEMLRDAQ
ncbi:MAG: M20/M25/M40 family metallo-hydrolase [Balneolaceae bacterium]|nr:MAG: M20/M25/M40 family metallo-hydrolase [Balneolaceae bacterium]